MRTLGFLLIGLVLVAGAIALGGYRHVYEPHVKRTHDNLAMPRNAQAPSRSVAPAGRSAAPSASVPTVSLGTWSTFEMIINVLNVVVGVIGIVLTFVGLRAQRAATEQVAAMHAQRR